MNINEFQETQLKGVIKMAENCQQFAASDESCEMYKKLFGGLAKPTMDCSIGTIFHVSLERKIFGYQEISISIPKRRFLSGLYEEPIKINLF